MEGIVCPHNPYYGVTQDYINYIAGEVVQEGVQRSLISSLIRTISRISHVLGQDTPLSQADSFLTQTVTEAITPITHQAHQRAMSYTDVTDTHSLFRCRRAEPYMPCMQEEGGV